jgi:hypothetical protein
MKKISNKIKELNERMENNNLSGINGLQIINSQISEAKERLMMSYMKKGPERSNEEIQIKAAEVAFYSLQLLDSLGLDFDESFEKMFDWQNSRFTDHEKVKENDGSLITMNDRGEHFKVNKKGMLI